MVLGGSGCFRTDGTTQLGTRKMISGLMGIAYGGASWVPKPVQDSERLPIFLW